MSRYVYDWEDDNRLVVFQVNYDYIEGYTAINRYVPAQIIVSSIEILGVDYFNPGGDCIASIIGSDMQTDARLQLIAEVTTKVLVEIDKCDSFYDCLVGNA